MKTKTIKTNKKQKKKDKKEISLAKRGRARSEIRFQSIRVYPPPDRCLSVFETMY